jgi:predicted pyridoxine 5'-phosphate oxidase superfamily flavin-nucleotide-binding protein
VLKNKKPKTSITFQNFAVKLTPEEQKRLELSAKVSSSVFLLIQRVGNAKAEPAPDEAKFVSKGKAEIRVYLADKTPEALEELKKAGFEIVIDPTTAKFVAGRIAIEKLVSLAEIKSVAFIAPQIKAN